VCERISALLCMCVCTVFVHAFLCTDLLQGEGAHAECGQFHSVQYGDLSHPIGLGTPAWPVLVTLYLQEQETPSSASLLSK
jgi:hypothetical protein